MRMNGCVMLVFNPPDGLENDAQAICGWVAATLGDADGEAKIWRTS